MTNPVAFISGAMFLYYCYGLMQIALHRARKHRMSAWENIGTEAAAILLVAFAAYMLIRFIEAIGDAA